MKNIFKLTTLLVASSLMLYSCAQTELDTDQFDDTAVLLNAYGPQPVVRGGVLRFVGSNLDKVVSVTIPDNNVITDIEVVSSGVHSEIRITVPKETSAPGLPVLTLADGTTITGKTQLTYSEPISIESMTPASVYPGDQITLAGEYLNLIHEVIFTKDVKVSEADFVEHTRYKIVVKVPAEAQTGVVGIGTVDESTAAEDVLATLNIIETEEELTVGTAKGKLASATAKAGSTVTINGDHLKLVNKILIGFYEVTEFVATDSKLTFTLPAEAGDGEVILVMASGVEVNAGELTTAIPVVSGVSPSPLRPGAQLTISGTDLDLVNSVQVPCSDTSHEWVGFELNNKGALVFTVPADATGANIILHKANGTTVEVAYTLVAPVISAVAPLPVPAGENFTITGTDLDLVTAVKIGDQELEFDVVSDKELSVKTAPATLGGKLVLITASGAEIAYDTDITFDYGSVTQVTSLTEKAAPGETITMTGSGFNAIEAIYIGGVKVTSYSKREDTEMVFLMPEVPAGVYTLEFLLTTGETESPVGFAITYEDEEGPEIRTIWTGEVDLGNWSGNVQLTVDQIGSLPAGTTLRIYYEGKEGDNPQFKICDINWTILPDFEQIANEWGVVNVPASGTMYDYPLGSADINAILNNEASWGGRGLVIAGQQCILKQIDLVIPPAGKLEPVLPTDIVLVDWDEHGGHNGYWDQPDGWGGVKTELASDDNGGLFLRVTEGSADQLWTVCCNHQSNFTDNVPNWVIDDASKYVLKIDVKLEGNASAADMTFNPVLGDKWPGGREAGLFPDTTGGNWITVTIDLGLTGTLDCSSGTNGFMAANVPTGICFDNFRFSLK